MLIFLSMLESDEERRLFTDLYNQYGNMMLHVAKRYFPKDMYAAEDVVQNAWIRVVDVPSTFRSDIDRLTRV